MRVVRVFFTMAASRGYTFEELHEKLGFESKVQTAEFIDNLERIGWVRDGWIEE